MKGYGKSYAALFPWRVLLERLRSQDSSPSVENALFQGTESQRTKKIQNVNISNRANYTPIKGIYI